MRHEACGELELSPEEQALLDRHSLLNLFNILELQLARLEDRVTGISFRSHTEFCLNVLMALSDHAIEDMLPEMEANCNRLRDDLERVREDHPEAAELLDGLMATIAIGHARLEEYKQDRYAWRKIPKTDFIENISAFLKAVESVSDRQTRFQVNGDRPPGDAYRVEVGFNGPEEALEAPLVLHDTIRDLVGNARKYSSPGSTISVLLGRSSNGGLQLQVMDEGIGIPEEEISHVVKFGYRASNALDRRTMGGGFGMTKAYSLCQRYQGRFIIESELGKGTTIEMTLHSPT
jgi:signal transduction histidine kinase